MSFSEAVPDAVASAIPLAEWLPDGLVVVGEDRRIRFVNAEATRILDRARSELLGHVLVAALPLTDTYGRDWWAAADPWLSDTGEEGHDERLVVTGSGREVLMTARYVREEPGGEIFRVFLGLRGAEARLAAEQDQASVLTTVAHELRAPLTSVLGFTSSLLRRWDRFSDDQKRLMIETIEADAKRLTRLITELLDISRLDSDRLTLRLGPVDIEALLSRHLLRHDLGLLPGDIRLELGERARADGVPELWADGDRLDQVFFNLIDNGVRHGAGTITVTLDRDPDEPDGVMVHVDDEGDGIPEANRPLVFGRFWHGPDNATSGLGLYVARGLVEAHGGDIEVGTAKTGGARFTVRLRSALSGTTGSGSGGDATGAGWSGQDATAALD
ncbi:MAG: ATP-binding protein [Micrococcales bacterium]|nr:ATP-binding protein [Micrococcales bacterium]